MGPTKRNKKKTEENEQKDVTSVHTPKKKSLLNNLSPAIKDPVKNKSTFKGKLDTAKIERLLESEEEIFECKINSGKSPAKNSDLKPRIVLILKKIQNDIKKNEINPISGENEKKIESTNKKSGEFSYNRRLSRSCSTVNTYKKDESLKPSGKNEKKTESTNCKAEKLSSGKRPTRSCSVNKTYNEDEMYKKFEQKAFEQTCFSTDNKNEPIVSPLGRKRTRSSKNNSDLKETDQEHMSECSEVDENNMWNANKNVSPKKQQKMSIAMQTPSKSTLRSSSKISMDTPTRNFENLSLNSTPKSNKNINNTPKRLPQRSFNQKLEDSEKNCRTECKKVSYADYNDFNDQMSESGDDSDKSYKVESDQDSSSEFESNSDIDDEEFSTKFPKNKRINIKVAKTPTKNQRYSKALEETPTKQFSRLSLKNSLTPSVKRRTIGISKPHTPLQEARLKLHVSVLPKSLPCREEQFNDIYTFLHARLSDNTGGCIYISGVPGTGKTATVNEVIRCLRKEKDIGKLSEFEFIDINGMKLSEPRQAYVQIWKQLTGETKTWEEAQKLLHSRFTKSNSKRGMTLLLVDELDLLCTKRQDVVYNLLDWPSKLDAKLVVVTIANTMDLPERILMGKVTSRLGLTRLTFPPYNFKQLEAIVVSRLKNQDAFSSDTIQLVARKVAAVSGDARRALDICRRATEVAEANKRETVTMIDVKQALDEMIASPKIQAIKHCSVMEKYFLQAVCSEVTRTGVEEVVFQMVYFQLKDLCAVDGEKTPNITQALSICARLGAYRLLLCEHSRQDIHQRIMLNVSADDIYFATQNVKI